MAGTINRWGVKSATLTFGGTTYDMASAPVGRSETKDAIEVTALSDAVRRYIVGALKETDEFTVSLFQVGASDLTVDATPAALVIAVTLENGVDADVSETVSIDRAIVTKVEYPNQDADGDRKATYDVTFRPDGSASA